MSRRRKSGVDHFENLSNPCIVPYCGQSADYTQWVCAGCFTRTQEQLRGIEQMHAELDATPGAGASDGQPRARGKKRPAPGNLDVIAALDPRSVPHAVGPDDVDGDVKSIPGTLSALESWLSDEFGWNGCDPVDVPGWIRSILVFLPLAACKQWFDELSADVAELHTQCERMTGHAEPRSSLAPCPMCSGNLRYDGENGSVLAVECRQCRTRYEGLELIELGQQRASQRAS